MIRIAAVSEDGVTISQHFGRAPIYVVVSVEGGRLLSRETRDKLGHAEFAAEAGEAPHEADPRGHGFDPVAQDRHARVVAAIADCQVLLARGMGAGAFASLQQAGIKPVVADVEDIDAAVEAYLAGTLRYQVEKLH
jgi:predicted Fe-Mo cluster-binding NifX family protein